jgi:REP element-mobilizing transposase RayT
MDYYQPLIPDNYYHIVHRAVGNETLFKEEENKQFFLQRYQKYIMPLADTFAYSLLENHFHFLVQIKAPEDISSLYKKTNSNNIEYNGWQQDFIMQQWSNLLNSYTKSFNTKYQRKGSLFMDYLRRVPVDTDTQFIATAFYIHKNAVHHGYCNKMEDWPYCSYKQLLLNSNSFIKKNEMLDWFGGLDKLIEYHQQPIYLKNAVALE